MPVATKLDAQMTLVASYQRKAPARGQPQAAPAVTNMAAVTKPAPSKPAATPTAARTNRPPGAASASATNRVSTRGPAAKSRLTNQPARKP